MRPDVELVLPAEPASVATARSAIQATGYGAGLSTRVVERMRLAVSEACTNVVLHAYEEPGTIKLKACLRDRGVCVVVCDEGSGMRPRPDSPGLGMGLPLIAAVCDELEVASEPGVGNELRMFFRAEDDSASALAA